MIQLFEEFINEEKQVGIIYHYTRIPNLLSILKDNKLISNSGVESFNKHSDKTYISISFTRNKDFHKSSNREENGIQGIQCRIVIDGTKLSNNYKIQPYDFYNGNFKRLSDIHEFEERIILDENDSIKNLDKYVISYEIFKSDYDTPYTNEMIEKCLSLNKKVKVIK